MTGHVHVAPPLPSRGRLATNLALQVLSLQDLQILPESEYIDERARAEINLKARNQAGLRVPRTLRHEGNANGNNVENWPVVGESKVPHLAIGNLVCHGRCRAAAV